MAEWNASGDATTDEQWAIQGETVRGEGRYHWLMTAPRWARDLMDEKGIDSTRRSPSQVRALVARLERMHEKQIEAGRKP